MMREHTIHKSMNSPHPRFRDGKLICLIAMCVHEDIDYWLNLDSGFASYNRLMFVVKANADW